MEWFWYLIASLGAGIGYYLGGEDPIAEIFPTSSTVVLLYQKICCRSE